jgi:hypothetical protein
LRGGTAKEVSLNRGKFYNSEGGLTVENPVTRVEGESDSFRPGTRSPAEADPILLALPARRRDAEACEPGLEQLQVIETTSGPKVERSLLVELLTRSPGLAQSLGDPQEVHNYHHPLAGVNAYKHRFHALRCEFVNTRLRTVELEQQLARSQERVERLENHIQFLDHTLTQMHASRAWQWAERLSRWQRSLVDGLGRLLAKRKTS